MHSQQVNASKQDSDPADYSVFLQRLQTQHNTGGRGAPPPPLPSAQQQQQQGSRGQDNSIWGALNNSPPPPPQQRVDPMSFNGNQQQHHPHQFADLHKHQYNHHLQQQQQEFRGQPQVQHGMTQQQVQHQQQQQQQQHMQQQRSGFQQYPAPNYNGSQGSGGKRTTPNSSSNSMTTSGEDSCSSSDRRSGQSKQAGNVAKKTSRPKRRANDPPHNFTAGGPQQQGQHVQVGLLPNGGMPSNINGGAGDYGRPPLYSGPNGGTGRPGEGADAAKAPRSKGGSPKIPPLQTGAIAQSHQWSSSGSDDGGREHDEHRLRQRSKQLNFGKVTVGYKNYRCSVPLAERQASNPRHPMTPDASQKCSKRRWDAMVAGWRRALHMWDENPSPDNMSVPGAPTLAELGEVVPVPFNEYMRETAEELQRIANEVASMHSGASDSSQTAGETSLEDVSSNADPHSVNTSVVSHRSGNNTERGDRSANNSAFHTPKEDPITTDGPGAHNTTTGEIAGAKTLISIVHVQPQGAVRNAWENPTQTKHNSTVTVTLVDQDATRLFAELQKHFDCTKLYYDRRVRDFPGAYYPENFSSEANSSDSAPMLPRLEYHGAVMPATVINPVTTNLPSLPSSGGAHATSGGKQGAQAAAASAAASTQQHSDVHGAGPANGNRNQTQLSSSNVTAATRTTAGAPLQMRTDQNGSEEVGREVQLTPTRFLLDEYQLQDLTFNPTTLEQAPTPTFPGGAGVTASNFFHSGAGAHSDNWLNQHLRDTSPVGTIGPAGGGGGGNGVGANYTQGQSNLATLPSALQLHSPTRRTN